MATFLSTTIPYANAGPHLGHAFEFVQADAFARHLSRHDAVFVSSGTDENGLKMVQSAAASGETTAAMAQRNSAEFARLARTLPLTVDRFVRTSTDLRHRAGAQELWRRMADRGDIYSRDYTGDYCVGCEAFLAPDELVRGRCAVHKVKPTATRERNWFFRLSRYATDLGAAVADDRIRIWPPSRRNEMLGLIRGGLTDISISRSTDRIHGWGIPVPGDDSQVMYVWIDALTNYVNALGWADGDPDYERYWAGARRRIHVLGKDVSRFHAVYWPAMLMSAGLPLPTDLVVHGHVLLSGHKLSKTLGNVIDPFDLIGRYGAEALRYLMLAEFSPWADADFTDQRLVARYNTDLAGGLGNLVERVTAMVRLYRGGVVPGRTAPVGPLEHDLLADAKRLSAACEQALDRFDHREAVCRLRELVRAVSAYLSRRAPWAEAEPAALDTALHTLIDVLRTIGGQLAPILPGASERMTDALGLRDRTDIAGARVQARPRLFPRLELTW
ncbi:methionine--tRNA ligase [Catenulispora sp. NL8]|uniref:methionine--tRNA ligase n=1 Tax=Catenulispora pinistramenti TaxID=2705254 RepID=A0ABS5KP89_9ACTN|nr:methionine--tRNA ligase [Catenulispora pinistramenti]MBS2547847.1 methionine--tRNA ligase [Catenulispora pinistramenti]